MKQIILADENTCKIDNKKCKCQLLCWACKKGKNLSRHNNHNNEISGVSKNVDFLLREGWKR